MNEPQETQPKPEAGLPLGAAPCSACGGDGIETCDNPDHALIDAVGGETGRLGCPCCGHHPRHKMRGPCPECNGTGITPNNQVQRPLADGDAGRKGNRE